MKIRRVILLILPLTGLFFNACNISKHVHKGQYLLLSNKIEIKQPVQPLHIDKITRNIDNSNELRTTLETLCRQHPNTRILNYLPLNLWIYNTFYSEKDMDKGYKWWIRTHVGEPPVILDTTLTYYTLKSMNIYLHNKGYFRSASEYKIIYKKKVEDTIAHKIFNKRIYFIVGNPILSKMFMSVHYAFPHIEYRPSNAVKNKVIVKYFIYPGRYYTYDSISYVSDNVYLSGLLHQASTASLLKTGDPYDVDVLDKERDRITHYFQDKGYFRFDKTQIRYDVDTIDAKHGKINVALHVLLALDTTKQVTYTINKIYVYPEYAPGIDLSQYKSDTLPYHNIYIVSELHSLKAYVLAENVFLKPGTLFSATTADKTTRRLNSVGLFKFVTVRYAINDSGKLNVYYLLTPIEKYVLQPNFEINNTIQNPVGTAIKLSYKDRNLAHSGVQFLADVSTGVEMTNFKYLYGESKNDFRLGIFDVSTKESLYWPRFIGPKKVANLFPISANPKTVLSVGAGYDDRIFYFTLKSINASYGYEWDASPRAHFIANIITVTYSKIVPTDTFQKIEDANPLLKLSLQYKFIPGGSYSYLYHSKRSDVQKSYHFIRINLIPSGNLLRLVTKPLDYNNTADVYKIGKDTFAQFTRIDFDYRHYHDFTKRNQLVFHFGTGVGFAYGNSTVMPYSEQFFIGGASGLRGWPVYALGPGTYHPPSSDVILYDQTGDIKLESNLEYRFSIIGRLKGAIFSDGGNIWTLKNETDRPGGQFNKTDVLNGIGWDAGVGLRVDFSFFIFRLDLATPLYDPTQLQDARWIETFKPFQWSWLNNHAVFNFAIGYPF